MFPRRRLATRRAAALALLLIGCTAAPASSRSAPAVSQQAAATPTITCPAACEVVAPPPMVVPTIRGPLALTVEGAVRGSFALLGGEVDLVDLAGVLRWRAPIGAAAEVRLVTEGDFTGDGVPDAIFRVLATEPGRTCGGVAMAITQLVFVDGGDGRTWRPLPALEDLCWDGFGRTAPYATHQWGTGTAYIGAFAGVRGAVVTFPYYATAGRVLRFTGDGFEAVAGRSAGELVFPSTARYDMVYNRSNSEPCSIPYPGGPCYVAHAHVPNLVWSGDALFVLTSARAFLYRPDFSPSSDLTWVSGGRLDNGGRNYGLVSVLPNGAITLVGGCSVINTRMTMRNGVNGNIDCSLHHHYEWFGITGEAVTGHSSRYYGYEPTDGPWEDRIEYPMHAAAAIAGRWGLLFNRFHGEGWAMQLLAQPDRPDEAIEFPGWYAWDTVPLGDGGQVAVLATRIDAKGATAPPWNFDVLIWSGGVPRSVAHFDGMAPALVPYPGNRGLHASDGLLYGVLTADHGRGAALLVEEPNGHRGYVDLPGLAGLAVGGQGW